MFGFMHEIKRKDGEGGFLFPAAYFTPECVREIFALMLKHGIKADEYKLIIIECGGCK